MWLLNYICRSPRSPSLLMSQTFTITNPSPGIELLRRLTFKVEPPDWKGKLDYFNYADSTHRKWISAGRRLFHLDRETSTSCLARGTGARPDLSPVSSSLILMSFLTSDRTCIMPGLGTVTSPHHQLNKYWENKLEMTKFSFSNWCSFLKSNIF